MKLVGIILVSFRHDYRLVSQRDSVFKMSKLDLSEMFSLVTPIIQPFIITLT